MKQLTVIGTNHRQGNSRIWLEGKRLAEAGFTVGSRYKRIVIKGDETTNATPSIILGLDVDGEYRVSGKGEKPIIDITGKVVRETFPQSDGDDFAEKQIVEVEYKIGCIVIQRPKEVSK